MGVAGWEFRRASQVCKGYNIVNIRFARVTRLYDCAIQSLIRVSLPVVMAMNAR